ncbi:methyltransferase domain-containing protein [Glonium stellatum]|uniref:Methyltransferase domain-containing protein n=1 Tax=Glonium stellatum TaxID=574774 RepID=A0A8E2ERR5_9PEZI|nr:methyltransferase domain-containing protein [Glonium stellatum]
MEEPTTSEAAPQNDTQGSPEPDSQDIVEPASTEEDSTYGEDEFRSYATSLSSSVEKYQWEHGRRFHAYREGSYQFPNDEKEQDRLDLFHHLFTIALGDKLHLAPIPSSKSIRILDIGTGTGIWAMEMGEKYPDAEVIGNDFSPIQPRWVPPNVEFEVDDCESPWPERLPFDFIHSRYMAGSIQDWPKLIRQCYENTAPNGWVEFQDFDLRNYSEDNSIDAENKVLELYNLLIDGCEKAGRTACPGPRLENWVEEAGFRNVRHETFRLPLGPWPKDPRMKNIGALNLMQFLDGLEAFTIGLFTRMHGWSPERVQVFLKDVRQDAKRRSVHMMHTFHVVYAQRINEATQ